MDNMTKYIIGYLITLFMVEYCVILCEKRQRFENGLS